MVAAEVWDVLSVVWYTAAIGGAVAAIAGLLVRGSRRRQLLIVAGFGFTIAGILGILSIGIVFIVLAALCFGIASRVVP